MNTLPTPILLDIAILFTRAVVGTGHVFGRQKSVCLRVPRHRLLRMPLRLQRCKPWRTSMGGGRRPNSFGFRASVVRSEESAEDAIGLSRDLGDLYRIPCPVEQISSFRLADSRVEIALLNGAKNPI